MSKMYRLVVGVVALLVFSTTPAFSQTYFSPYSRTQYRMMWEYYGISPFHNGTRQSTQYVYPRPQVVLKPILVVPESKPVQSVPTPIQVSPKPAIQEQDDSVVIGVVEPVDLDRAIHPPRSSVLENFTPNISSKAKMVGPVRKATSKTNAKPTDAAAESIAVELANKKPEAEETQPHSLSDLEPPSPSTSTQTRNEVSAKVEKLSLEKQEMKKQLFSVRKQARTLEQRARNAERQLNDVRKNAQEQHKRDLEDRKELESILAKMKAEQDQRLAEAMAKRDEPADQNPVGSTDGDSAKVIDRLKKANANLSRKTVELQRALENERRANRLVKPKTPTLVKPQSTLSKNQVAPKGQKKPESVLQSLRPGGTQSKATNPDSNKGNEQPTARKVVRPTRRTPQPPTPPQTKVTAKNPPSKDVTTVRERTLESKIAAIREQQKQELSELLDRVETRFERRLRLLNPQDREFSAKKKRLEQDSQQTIEIIKARNKMRFEGKIDALKAESAK